MQILKEGSTTPPKAKWFRSCHEAEPQHRRRSGSSFRDEKTIAGNQEPGTDNDGAIVFTFLKFVVEIN